MLPESLKGRVEALVSDGFRGGKGIACGHGWGFQRCHFHLIASLQAVRGTRKSLPAATVREAVYRLVCAALQPQQARCLPVLQSRLRKLAVSPECPRRLRMIVRDFLRELPSFRAYLEHPELHLPTTTNAVESMGSILRRRVRTLRSPQALEQWAKALVRLRPRITCNGAGFAQD